jgi:hypothetical protein
LTRTDLPFGNSVFENGDVVRQLHDCYMGLADLHGDEVHEPQHPRLV